jgi:antirestriction protein ArdC
LKSYLKTMARFPRYSLYNAMLIAMQRPHACRVAGFRAWNKLGRHVGREEKGIYIFSPIVIHRETDDEEEEEVIAFKTAYVFDVEQTDGRALPMLQQTKENPESYLDELKVVIREKGIALEYRDLHATTFGMSAGGRIILKHGLDAAEEFSVLVHELAHEMLHQACGEEANKTARETEAEAVAFVVSEARLAWIPKQRQATSSSSTTATIGS